MSDMEQYNLDAVKDKTDRELIIDVLGVLTNDHEHRLENIEDALYKINDRLSVLQKNDGIMIDLYHRIEKGLKKVKLM